MKRTRNIVLILTILLSIYVIGDCHSQDDTEKRELMTVDGKAAEVDISRSTITIKSANELTFSVPVNTPIVDDIYDIKLSDIEPEYDVMVEYYAGSLGKLIATKITVKNKEL